MNLFKKLTTRRIYVVLKPHLITVKDLDSGIEITREPIEPYSCGRLLISNFSVFVNFFKSVLLELFPKNGLLVKSYDMRVEVKHNFETPISAIEIRAVVDSAEHAGAK